VDENGSVDVMPQGDVVQSGEAGNTDGQPDGSVPTAGETTVDDEVGDVRDVDAVDVDAVDVDAVDVEAGHGEADDVEGAGSGDVEGGVPGGAPRSGLRRLEEEGEVAADYLEELLDIVDLDGDIDIDVENGRASVAIVAEGALERDLKRLVGGRGEVLEALQELTRLAVQARTGERSRLMLDVAGFRAARRRALEDVAARACQDVKRTGEPMKLDPMSAFERKVVHDAVAEAGLRSESEGEEPTRRVVILPAGA
jgi:spoIIIJ-associated protein